MKDAQKSQNYSLVNIQSSKRVLLAKASYNKKALTVTLTTRKPLVMKLPLNLTIEAAGLGLASNVVAEVTKAGAKITSAVPLVKARGLSARVVDALFGAEFRPRARHSRS